MLNISWITGTVTHLSETHGIIENHYQNKINRIEFLLNKQDSLPDWVEIGSVIKIMGRVIPYTLAGTEKLISKVIFVEPPSIFDLTPDPKIKRKIKQPNEQNATPDRVIQSNMVKMAGYITYCSANKFQNTNNTIINFIDITLSQIDMTEKIPIKFICYNPQAIIKRLHLYDALKVEGEFNSSFFPEQNLPFILTRQIYVSNQHDIKETPNWVKTAKDQLKDQKQNSN